MATGLSRAKLKLIQKLAEKASSQWYGYSREGDYVSFGPDFRIKDNREGNNADYRLTGLLTPDIVLKLCAAAEKSIK